ncbi:MAG: sigma-70 family RNA polymerase sigma factor [Saprospiraceae bacterium]|nr:sigma-70 family RNA polymerase sigma factor [Saprospiraceae bacterium]
MKSAWDDLDHLKQHLERALDDLYQCYRPAFLRWLQAEYPNLDHHDRLDIFQDTVIVVWNNVRSERLSELRSTLWTYVCGIGKLLAMSKRRKQGRVSYVEDMTEYLKGMDSFSELEFMTRDELDLIWKYIDQLDEPYCSVLTLTFKYDLSSAEIAELMNAASAAVVRVQRNRGMNQLRQLVKTQQI